MNLQVTSDNIEVTPSMRALAKNKVGRIFDKLKNFPEDMIDMRVVLNKGSAEGTFDARVSFFAGGKTIVGKDYEYSLESALIKAIDDALRQYDKEKSKKESEEWEERRKMKTYQSNSSEDLG